MAVKFGVFIRRAGAWTWRRSKDPIDKYEAMTKVAPAADRGALDRWSGATATATRRSAPRWPSTVAVASHGRLNAGIGAGWYEHDWRAYGCFPELKERMGMFTEACEIIHRMCTED